MMTGGGAEEEAGEYGEAEQDFERGASNAAREMQGSGMILYPTLALYLELYLCLYLQLYL